MAVVPSRGLGYLAFSRGKILLTLPSRKVGGPPPPPPIDARMVAWWKMDEGGGTVLLDSTGRGNSATLIGGPAWVTDPDFGDVLEFDGVNDQYGIGVGSDTGAVFPNPVKYTVCVWLNCGIQLSSGGASKFVLSNHPVVATPSISAGVNSASAGISSPNRNKFFSNGANSNTAVTGSSWIHCATTHDEVGPTGEIYLNGLLDRTQTVAGGISAGDGFAYVIGLLTNGASFTSRYSGRMFDMRVYKDVLSAADILKIASSPRA